MKLAIFELAFDKTVGATAIIHRRFHLSQPNVLAIIIPARYLASEGFRPEVGNSLGQNMVAALQQPEELFITARSAIHAPHDPLALAGGQV